MSEPPKLVQPSITPAVSAAAPVTVSNAASVTSVDARPWYLVPGAFRLISTSLSSSPGRAEQRH